MMGFGGPCNFTPAYSGRLKVEFFGDVTNNTGGNITNLNIRYGTGIPPSFNAVATGTVAIGNSPAVGHPTANSLSMFALSAVITGLTPGTQYWLDMVGSTNANTSTISNVSCNAMEF